MGHARELGHVATQGNARQAGGHETAIKATAETARIGMMEKDAGRALYFLESVRDELCRSFGPGALPLSLLRGGRAPEAARFLALMDEFAIQSERTLALLYVKKLPYLEDEPEAGMREAV